MRLDDVLRSQSETTTQEASADQEATSNSSVEHSATATAAVGAIGAIPADRFLAVEGARTAQTTQAPPVQVPPVQAPGASLLNPVREMSFSTLGWHSMWPSHAKRPFWPSMPPFNQFLTVVGGACLLLALLRVVGPPVAESARLACRPYTAEGKQELCTTHLRAVALALAAYAQDNDGRYPPLDYQDAHGRRTTWVSLVRGRLKEDDLVCPLGPELTGGPESLTSSFVLNPVVATARATEVDDASSTVLLAEGGSRHDVSLLPPLPTWPSYSKRGAGGSLAAEECNFGFRHEGQAGVVYVDGHTGTLSAGSLSSGSGAAEVAMWGGSAVLRRAYTRLSQRSPQVAEFFKRLQADEVPAASSYLKVHRVALKAASADLVALWRLNSGEHTSNKIEQLGWDLARAWQVTGDAAWMTHLNQQQTDRSQEQLQQVQSSEWERREVSGQPTLRCQAPAAWTLQDEREGRYRRLYIRSSLPAVYMVLEVGARDRYVTPRPINWSGSEDDLRKRYGRTGYRRVNLSAGILAGHEASVWEYELQKPGGPRLRRRYIGYTDGWTSYVAGCTAPARDWALWKPRFDRVKEGMETG